MIKVKFLKDKTFEDAQISVIYQIIIHKYILHFKCIHKLKIQIKLLKSLLTHTIFISIHLRVIKK